MKRYLITPKGEGYQAKELPITRQVRVLDGDGQPIVDAEATANQTPPKVPKRINGWAVLDEQSEVVMMDGPKRPIYQTRTEAVPRPTLHGNARLYEGEKEPTPEQMAALFAASPVPESIDPAQLRMELDRRGLDDAKLRDLIDQLPDERTKKDALIQLEWRTGFRRDNPLVVAVAGMLGIELDEFFTAAARL